MFYLLYICGDVYRRILVDPLTFFLLMGGPFSPCGGFFATFSPCGGSFLGLPPYENSAGTHAVISYTFVSKLYTVIGPEPQDLIPYLFNNR